ncbi:hypothetical protein [Xanthobacter aminoxidans]|uniref:hypothetical protein n=1 Tax=Xanthobacter aminoxidans TaxID=186280 RepID=UPI002022FAB0|nr:hypothetical protein [Xanthobacter aminoxidans]MCL8384154.1 hypothetical protein [Xanthobacter aminoxidans]
MTALLAWIVNLLSPFKKYLAIFGVVFTLLGAVFLKGRGAGKAAERKAQTDAIQKIEREWDAIDSAPSAAGDAFDSLRQRARPGR